MLFNSAFINALNTVRRELSAHRVNPVNFTLAIEWACSRTTRRKYNAALYVDYVYPIALYLEYVNNYLSVRRFAEDFGLTLEGARNLLAVGENLHKTECNAIKAIRGIL